LAKQPKKKPNQPVPVRQPTTGWLAAAQVVDSVIDKFGWPGAVLLYVVYLIERHATEEQRRAIIDLYLLGKGVQAVYPVLVIGGLFSLVAIAQRHYYRKRIKLMEAEIQRLGSEKSYAQESALGITLHHSEPPEGSK